MILTIANLKGGSTRTTTAMLLAWAFTRLGYPVTVVDTDPRQSATRWNTRAQGAADPLPFPVISHPLPDQVLHEEPERVAEVAQFDAPNSVTIIDTPSHIPQIVPVTEEISDFVLVPFATGTGEAVAVAPGVWAELAPGATAEDAVNAGIFSGYCSSKEAFEREYLNGEPTAGNCW